MEPNLHEYPYTQYEDGCSMGCFMGMCRRAGVKLAVVGDSLQLLDKNNFVLSQVKIAIAQSALKDELGNNITAYIINAGTREDTVVFTKGNGDEIVVTVPFATTARYDKSGNEIDDYIIDVQAVGDNLAITRGDGVTYSVTCPYATKAFTDVNNKPLTTYAASMEVSGNNVVLKDGMGTVISTITVHFAERAAADENGNNIRESYASVLQAGTTTVKLIAKSGDLLSEITVPYATSALKDTNGNEFLKDYAETLVVDNDGKRLDLLAHDGTLLSAITVPFSTLATDATNAIERAEIVGDQLVLTTYGGVVTRLTIPYAIRSLNDGASNEITKTYVHNVVQDPITGEITFYDAEGTALCSLIPNARVAEYDTYNNLIADYIKTLVFDNQSDYLVATHGDGTADTIVVNYATKAWKDTQGNIIKNTYIAFLANVVDNEGEWVLVAYNGEGSELFRLKVVANKAQKDQLGNVIDTFYAHEISISNYSLSLLDAHGTTLGSVTLPKNGTHIEYEPNPNNTREYYMNLQNADDQNLDSKIMYFDTDGYDIMFGQIDPDWKELSRIGTPMDARTINFEQDANNADYFDIKLRDADDRDTDVKGIHATIDNGDLVFTQEYPDNNEICRVTLPSSISSGVELKHSALNPTNDSIAVNINGYNGSTAAAIQMDAMYTEKSKFVSYIPVIYDIIMDGKCYGSIIVDTGMLRVPNPVNAASKYLTPVIKDNVLPKASQSLMMLSIGTNQSFTYDDMLKSRLSNIPVEYQRNIDGYFNGKLVKLGILRNNNLNMENNEIERGISLVYTDDNVYLPNYKIEQGSSHVAGWNDYSSNMNAILFRNNTYDTTAYSNIYLKEAYSKINRPYRYYAASCPNGDGVHIESISRTHLNDGELSFSGIIPAGSYSGAEFKSLDAYGVETACTITVSENLIEVTGIPAGDVAGWLSLGNNQLALYITYKTFDHELD